METISSPKKQSYKFLIRDNFQKTWAILKDIKITNLICSEKIFPGMATEPLFIKGTNTREIGNDFYFDWKGMVRLFFRVGEVIEKENFAKIKWIVYKTEPKIIEYNLIYYLHEIPKKNICYLIVEQLYHNKIKTTKNQLIENHNEMVLLFSTIEKYIIEQDSKNYQMESICIQE